MINGVGNASSRAEGIKEGLMTVIYTAFEQGLSTEVIASLTHMSIEEIERLRETSSV